MKLTKREKVLIILLMILILLYGYYIFIFKPAWVKIQKLEEKSKKYKEMLVIKNLQIDKHEFVEEELKELNSKILGLSNSYFPEMLQETSILILDKIIKQSGIQIKNISFSQPTISTVEIKKKERKKTEGYLLKELANAYYYKMDKNNNLNSKEKNEKTAEKEGNHCIEKMEVTLNTQGSYYNICNFVDLVNQIDKKIVIQSIHIFSEEDMLLSANIILDFYTIPVIKPGKVDENFWPFKRNYGKVNPFEDRF